MRKSRSSLNLDSDVESVYEGGDQGKDYPNLLSTHLPKLKYSLLFLKRFEPIAVQPATEGAIPGEEPHAVLTSIPNAAAARLPLHHAEST